MICYKTLHISQGLSEKINGYLNAHNDNDYQCEDDTISITAVFPDNISIDIKCCGCKDAPSWTEAVLFKNGFEICCSEPMDTFIDEWRLEYGDIVYVVNVKIDDNLSIIERFNTWVRQIGLPDDVTNDEGELYSEYAPGQLDFAFQYIDSAVDWDDWQHIQACLGKAILFEDAMAIADILYQNDIEVLELETDKSKEYYKIIIKEIKL